MYGGRRELLPDAGFRVATRRQDTLDEREQGDLFGVSPAEAYRPDPEQVRRRIDSILKELREEISARHWEYGRSSFFRMVFPKLTCWLPEDEAARLEAKFEAEMRRLRAA